MNCLINMINFMNKVNQFRSKLNKLMIKKKIIMNVIQKF